MTTLAKRISVIKVQTKAIPKSWSKAVGLAKSKKKALQNHAAKVRKEWDK
jgi:hypothetical protein